MIKTSNIHTCVEMYKYSIVTFGIVGLHCVVYSHNSECHSPSAHSYTQDAHLEFALNIFLHVG